MLPIVVHADDEIAVIQYLSQVPEVTALCPPDAIRTELPAQPRVSYPTVLITRLAGEGIWPGLDEPVLAVDVYCSTKRDAKRLAQTVRGAILAIANDSVAECVLVSAVEEVGPQWLPDTIPTPPVPRYTARYRVITH